MRLSVPNEAAKPFDPKEYWESRLSGSFELKSVGYSLLGANYNGWMYRIRRAVFLREARAIRPNWNLSHVLDVGSGTGFYLRLWRELGAASITGADLTSVAVRKLQQDLADMRIFQLDISDTMPKEAGCYHAVSIFDVLFHIVDDDRYEAAICNLASLVKPGGYLFLSDNFVHSNVYRSEHHVSRTKGWIEEKLTKCGFEIVHRSPMFVLMNEPVDSESHFRHFFWKAFLKGVSVSEWVGFVAGAALYPLELMLTRVKRESASTELVVCRKR